MPMAGLMRQETGPRLKYSVNYTVMEYGHCSAFFSAPHVSNLVWGKLQVYPCHRSVIAVMLQL